MALDSLETPTKVDFLSLKSPYPIEIPSKGKRSKRQRSAAATSELEQGALDLLFLSRDVGSGSHKSDSESEGLQLQPSDGMKQSSYQCSICGKSFSSYQALGGHKTSHRKPVSGDDVANGNTSLPGAGGERVKVHQCTVCLRTFPSGQALGGHKRLHYEGGGTAAKLKFEFDLNMPAPEIETDQSVLVVEDRDGDNMVDFLGVKKQRFLLTA